MILLRTVVTTTSLEFRSIGACCYGLYQSYTRYEETISPINRTRQVTQQTGSRGLGFVRNERHSGGGRRRESATSVENVEERARALKRVHMRELGAPGESLRPILRKTRAKLPGSSRTVGSNMYRGPKLREAGFCCCLHMSSCTGNLEITVIGATCWVPAHRTESEPSRLRGCCRISSLASNMFSIEKQRGCSRYPCFHLYYVDKRRRRCAVM